MTLLPHRRCPYRVDARLHVTKTYFYYSDDVDHHEWQASLRWNGETEERRRGGGRRERWTIGEAEIVHERLRKWFVGIVDGLRDGTDRHNFRDVDDDD